MNLPQGFFQHTNLRLRGVLLRFDHIRRLHDFPEFSCTWHAAQLTRAPGHPLTQYVTTALAGAHHVGFSAILHMKYDPPVSRLLQRSGTHFTLVASRCYGFMRRRLVRWSMSCTLALGRKAFLRNARSHPSILRPQAGVLSGETPPLASPSSRNHSIYAKSKLLSGVLIGSFTLGMQMMNSLVLDHTDLFTCPST